MLHCGAISGTIDRSKAAPAPSAGTPGAGTTPPVHDLNVPYEATSEEYATPTADMLFPPVRNPQPPPPRPAPLSDWSRSLRIEWLTGRVLMRLYLDADAATNPDPDPSSRNRCRDVQHSHWAFRLCPFPDQWREEWHGHEWSWSKDWSPESLHGRINLVLLLIYLCCSPFGLEFIIVMLQPPPSPWMTQRPLGVDVNVGMCLCYAQFLFSGLNIRSQLDWLEKYWLGRSNDFANFDSCAAYVENREDPDRTGQPPQLTKVKMSMLCWNWSLFAVSICFCYFW